MNEKKDFKIPTLSLEGGSLKPNCFKGKYEEESMVLF